MIGAHVAKQGAAQLGAVHCAVNAKDLGFGGRRVILPLEPQVFGDEWEGVLDEVASELVRRSPGPRPQEFRTTQQLVLAKENKIVLPLILTEYMHIGSYNKIFIHCGRAPRTFRH